ncbi:MAG: hypothetical protein KAX45_04805 [Chitinophagaceae bacterium]|nr:hypothetical protein [Chitinophagaceae bacterium]
MEIIDPSMLMHYKMKYFLILTFCSVIFIEAGAQNNHHHWKAEAALQFPVGLFGETHFPGASIAMEYGRIPFGQTDSTQPRPKTGLLLRGALHHYLGRQVTVSNADFKYRGYSVFELYTGLAWNCRRNLQVAISGGPALSYYRSNIRFNLGARAAANYFLNSKWGIGSAISVLKENGADPLAALSITGVYRF